MIKARPNENEEEDDPSNHQLTYEEFRITKSQLIEKEPILVGFIKPKMSMYAFGRCKYNMA